MKTILLIDDKENILKVLKVILEKEGYRIKTADNGREGLKLAVKLNPDLVVSDVRMDDLSGSEIFHLLKARGFDIPFIFITAYASIEGAVSAIKDGAVDYLTKPVNHEQLKKSIARLLKIKRKDINSEKVLIGSSRVMEKLYKRIDAVAGSSSTVLITGESGTGKELIARAIHKKSRKRRGPFIPVNCSAFSTSILESEIFGHEKGAFTGAVQQKIGFFEAAHGGTLFIDEISEMPLATQVKLLRVIQEHSFRRVGGTSFINIDVRIIAASNKDLDNLVESGEFRHDLFYRLNVIPIKSPPLRDHLEDMAELVDSCVKRICSQEEVEFPVIETDFIDVLKSYPWPGNVRELENLIERLLIIHTPSRMNEKLLYEESDLFSPLSFTSSNERERIVKALRLCGANKTESAKILDMPRRTLYHKISKYDIQREEYSSM